MNKDNKPKVLLRALEPEDLDLLDSVGNNMAGRTICALADAAVFPGRSFTKHFREEFEHYIEHGKPMKPHQWGGW